MNILSKIGTGTANEGQQMEILGVDGKPLTEDEAQKPFLTILGADSTIFRDAKYQISMELMKEREIDENHKDTPDASRERRIRLVGACIIGWKNIQDEDNAVIECNAENVAYVLEESPHLLDMVDTFLSTRENFLKKA